MTPYQRVEATITKQAHRWQQRLGLSHWDITHVFLDSFDDDQSSDDYKTTAITEARWQYLQARIKWFLPSAARHDDAELEKILVHELCHVLLAPEQQLVDTSIDHGSAHNQYSSVENDALAARNYECLELATEMATRAILNCWNADKG